MIHLNIHNLQLSERWRLHSIEHYYSPVQHYDHCQEQYDACCFFGWKNSYNIEYLLLLLLCLVPLVLQNVVMLPVPAPVVARDYFHLFFLGAILQYVFMVVVCLTSILRLFLLDIFVFHYPFLYCFAPLFHHSYVSLVWCFG